MSENDEAFRQAAKDQWASIICQVDEGGKVSVGETGAWVAAWVWVSNEAAGIEKSHKDDG